MYVREQKGCQLEWKILHDVKAGDEAITVYNGFDAIEFRRMKMRVFKEWEQQRQHLDMSSNERKGKGSGEETLSTFDQMQAKLAAMQARIATMEEERRAEKERHEVREAQLLAVIPAELRGQLKT